MKLTPEILEELLRLRASGKTQNDLQKHVLKKHGIKVNQSSLSRCLAKHRGERAEISRAVVQAYAEKSIPADLEAMDRVQEKNLQLLDEAQEAARKVPSLANVDKVVKLTAAVARADETKRKALGLDDPTESINYQGLADLVGLALE